MAVNVVVQFQVVTKSMEKDYNQFWQTVHDRDSLVFVVRSCENAYILLSNMLGVSETNTYEVDQLYISYLSL